MILASSDDYFHHLRDTKIWELPKFVLDALGRDRHLVLPGLLTKYMVLQVVAALLVFVIFSGLASRIKGGKPARGLWWNFWEMLALYIRDEVVRPSIGYPHHAHADHHHDDHGHAAGQDTHADPHGVVVAHSVAEAGSPAVAVQSDGSAAAVEVGHPADRYLPYVWSVFFYILFCNLMGAVPLLGAPTANLNVTGVLALVTFLHVVYFGSEQSSLGGFVKSLVPSMDLPGVLGQVLIFCIWCIEAVGFVIKHSVLAIRLFANIMAGHTVLSVFLMFIAFTANTYLWGLVMPASIFAQVAIGLLELFVAFLQAYVFALLTSIFISAAVNPH